MKIIIEDNIVPQLLTSAIEAFEFGTMLDSKGKIKLIDKLETFGLLWGYIHSEHEDSGLPARLVVNMITVETSALRKQDSVRPNLESVKMKRDFFRKYWPQHELIGTFHSHPYTSLAEVNDCRGWRASEADIDFFPYFHEEINSELPAMAHLIATVTMLQRLGWAWPSRLENDSMYALSSDYRKFWIKGLATIQDDDDNIGIKKEICLDIPSLERRFL